MNTSKNPFPAEVVFDPSWWHANEGIDFDKGFFFDPERRMEDEWRMEKALKRRFGSLLVTDDSPRAQLGGVHLAAGFMLSWMLGCDVDFRKDGPPLVHALNADAMYLDPDMPFRSEAFETLCESAEGMKSHFGRVYGDIDFSGILNLALDVRGIDLYYDLIDDPDAVDELFASIAAVIERFVNWVSGYSETTSISVNRTVRHLTKPLFLHSECSHTMISVKDYRRFLMPYDEKWSTYYDSFGIHYCGKDPHRYAQCFSELPCLDFLDVGWGGDVALLRKALPNTFLNLRLSPSEISCMDTNAISACVKNLLVQSQKPYLTGVCCINMDEKVQDEQVIALLRTVAEERERIV